MQQILVTKTVPLTFGKNSIYIINFIPSKYSITAFCVSVLSWFLSVHNRLSWAFSISAYLQMKSIGSTWNLLDHSIRTFLKSNYLPLHSGLNGQHLCTVRTTELKVNMKAMFPSSISANKGTFHHVHGRREPIRSRWKTKITKAGW